jgi:hypothetical protein
MAPSDKNKRAGPPPRIAPPPATPAKHPPSKPLANTLMDDVVDKRPAIGRGTPVGSDPSPMPPTNVAPVEPGPERAKRDKNKK